MSGSLIYIAGEPGSGKTTLMTKLTEGLDRHPAVGTDVPHDYLLNKVGDLVAMELGRRRGTFSGTDALSSSIIAKAEQWLCQHEAELVLAEGARLANRRFLMFAAQAGYMVTLVVLDHPDAANWRAARARQIGKTQNGSWVAGRRTATLNLMNGLRGVEKINIMSGHPDDLTDKLRVRMNQCVG